MDKIKKALRLGDPVYKHDDDFDAAIQRMRREQEQEMKRIEYESQRRMNAAQERYGYGWDDPRRMMNAASQPKEKLLIDSLADTNQAMKRLYERMEKQERRIEMLTGFYTWITEVYPEIAAQHKAMRDLYEAANSNENQTEAGP